MIMNGSFGRLGNYPNFVQSLLAQSLKPKVSGVGGGVRSLRKDALVHHSSSFFASKANEGMNSNPKLVNY